jgi:hypothetical protein
MRKSMAVERDGETWQHDGQISSFRSRRAGGGNRTIAIQNGGKVRIEHATTSRFLAEAPPLCKADGCDVFHAGNSTGILESCRL